MPYTSGTATDYKNLLSILVTFAASNGWTILEQTATKVYLKGTGLTGLDEIYGGIECVELTGSYYNWRIAGSVSWKSDRTDLTNQPLSSGAKYVYLWNQPIPYWIVANGRRIIVVAKITTTYQWFHLGLLTPCSTEKQNPYPLLIGGCGQNFSSTYSDTSNSAFWNNIAPSAFLNGPGGIYRRGCTRTDIYPESPGFSFYSANIEMMPTMMVDLSGNYYIEEIFAVEDRYKAIYGKVEGLFKVTGDGNSSENVIAISSVDYKVFADMHRTTPSDYVALRLN
jgi:hypothetical protein